MNAEQISKILEAVVDPAIIIDDKGIIIGMNQQTSRIFGYANEEMINENVSMLMPPAIAREHDRYLKTYNMTGKQHIIGIGREVVGQHKDGSQFPLYLSVGELKNDKGHKIYIGTLNDLRQRDALHAAEAAAEAKALFLANMSHELRTPLNAILTFTQILLSEGLPDEHQDLLNRIFLGGKRLLHEVEQILTFSKLEAGKNTCEIVPFELMSCLESIIDMQRPDQEKNIDLVLEVDKDIPFSIKTDPFALDAILTNLLSNAIKFSHYHQNDHFQNTNHKKVTLRVFKEVKDSDSITFAVIDQGIGIPPDKQIHIFQQFSQADESTTRKYGGTGLGLAIVQKLIEQLNGSISLGEFAGQGQHILCNHSLC